jgi:hypothetical protein
LFSQAGIPWDINNYFMCFSTETLKKTSGIEEAVAGN